MALTGPKDQLLPSSRITSDTILVVGINDWPVVKTKVNTCLGFSSTLGVFEKTSRTPGRHDESPLLSIGCHTIKLDHVIGV